MNRLTGLFRNLSLLLLLGGLLMMRPNRAAGACYPLWDTCADGSLMWVCSVSAECIGFWCGNSAILICEE